MSCTLICVLDQDKSQTKNTNIKSQSFIKSKQTFTQTLTQTHNDKKYYLEYRHLVLVSRRIRSCVAAVQISLVKSEYHNQYYSKYFTEIN